jgi:2-polyprenyl-6-methoxyphenol hydroxylase-like FAD-dependent oxidoreductase
VVFLPVRLVTLNGGLTMWFLGEKETIHARYLIACDGAHSWVRNQLDVQTDTVSEESTWGVLDIVPITDFRLFYLPVHGTLN